MNSFLFCLVLVAIIALGGREQVLVGQLSDALADRGGTIDKRPLPLLLLAIASAAVTAGIMAYAGATIAAQLPQRAAQMLVALALVLAAFELAWPVRPKPVNEPTRSGFAVAAVLFWWQLGDAARFVIFAFAAGAPYPLTAFLGGALGGAAATSLGWWLGYEAMAKWPLRWIRLGLALAIIVAALFIGLNARYGTR